MKVLEIKIDQVNKKEAREKVIDFLSLTGQNKIFTPNPEMLVDAQTDNYFKEVLNSGELNICDGFGVSLVSLGKIKRYAGVDFMLDTCCLAEKQAKSIFLLGAGENVAKKVTEKLQQKFSNLKIAGYDAGVQLKIKDEKLQINEAENNEMMDKINKSGAKILFVAFGHNKQEKWIYENLSRLPNVKIAMGVGGAFDYIAQIVKRAPKWMQKIGIEWLYRLIKQPKRIKRIYKATFKFLKLYVTK